jgi:hypothetical protein
MPVNIWYVAKVQRSLQCQSLLINCSHIFSCDILFCHPLCVFHVSAVFICLTAEVICDAGRGQAQPLFSSSRQLPSSWISALSTITSGRYIMKRLFRRSNTYFTKLLIIIFRCAITCIIRVFSKVTGYLLFDDCVHPNFPLFQERIPSAW